MRPVLWQWRNFRLWSYPAMLYSGLLIGIVVSDLEAHAGGLNAFRVYAASIIFTAAALIGAKWFYVATHWSSYKQNPRSLLRRNQGGASLYGALIAVAAISFPLLSAMRIPVGAFCDFAVFAMLIVMIFGRVGCLLNGCCAGRPTQSWIGIHLPDCNGKWARRIPTPCLEAAWGLMLLATAAVLRPYAPFSGALFLIIVAGYAAGRLVLESTREEATLGRLTIHHAISFLVIVVSLATLVVRWPKQQEVIQWLTILPAILMW
jgi:phosphatidylglycerol---prolipoprotein diacylglyceryl transferase